jgi:hypothetical protein
LPSRVMATRDTLTSSGRQRDNDVAGLEYLRRWNDSTI